MRTGRGERGRARLAQCARVCGCNGEVRGPLHSECNEELAGPWQTAQVGCTARQGHSAGLGRPWRALEWCAGWWTQCGDSMRPMRLAKSRARQSDGRPGTGHARCHQIDHAHEVRNRMAKGMQGWHVMGRANERAMTEPQQHVGLLGVHSVRPPSALRNNLTVC